MGNFLNQKRLRDYPRLFFFTMWSFFILNWIFHRGWLGGVGQLIGNDFLAFYSGGVLMRTSPDKLYDLNQQMEFQHTLIASTELSGFVPFINPPYTSIFFSLFTFLPYFWAFIVWSMMMLMCFVLSVRLIRYGIIPEKLREKYFTPWQVFFLIASFFPFLVGIQVGQNHVVTLLLSLCVVVSILKQNEIASGIYAGFLIFKPQFLFGFFIFWISQKNLKALMGFGLVATSWVGITLAWRGIDPFIDYFKLTRIFLQIMGMKEMGSHFGITLYGLLVGIFGIQNWESLFKLSTIIMIVAGISLGIYTSHIKNNTSKEKTPALLLALLFPLVFSPHVLIYDAVLLIPFFALWTRWQPSRKVLYASIVVYLAFFLLPFIAFHLNIPLLAFIPIGLTIILLQDITRSNKSAKNISYEQESIYQ